MPNKFSTEISIDSISPESLLRDIGVEESTDDRTLLSRQKIPHIPMPDPVAKPAWQSPAWLTELEDDEDDYDWEEEAESSLVPSLPARSPVYSVDDADKYLSLLARKYISAEPLINIIQTAYDQLIDKTIKRDVLTHTLAEATAALYNLQKLSETFIEPQEKRDSLKAATIILDDLKKEIGKLSPALQDKFNKIYQKSIQGELVKIPKPYTSPFRAPKDIFIQNRINLIFKTHEGIDRINRDAGLKQASQIAQQEWDQISTIINTIIKQELGDNVPAEKIRTIQQTFINQILGGSSIEDTERFIRLYVKIGDKYEDIFSDIDYKEEGSVENAIFILTDKEKIEDELSEIPQSQALLVGKNIYDFGILCKKVIDTEANMLDMPSDESVAELKDLYFETSALGQKLLTIPEKWLKEIELFEWVYILRKNLLDLFSKYDFDSDNITYDPGEIKDFKQVGKEPRKALDPDKVRSPRDPTAEAEARKRYEEGTEELRRPLVQQRARERLKRPDVEEHRDVVGSDYRNIKTEINKWKSFATRSDVTQRDIDTLKRTHLQKTIDLFVRIKGSWLSKPELEKVILDLYENRVKNFSEAINSISSGNEFVINQLKQHFNSLSSYIKSAATKADTIDVVKKNPPNDIDWPRIQSLTELKLPQETPGDVVKRLPKISPIKRALYLVDIFFKYAML